MKNTNWKNNVSRFLGAQTLSLLGSSLVQYAIIWHVVLSTSSGLMMTVSTVCAFLPQILISLYAGVWIDRFNRKKLIMIADGMIALATLLLALTFLSGFQNNYLLFAVLIVRSAGNGVQTPCVNSLIPQLVPKEHLMRINGINSTLNSLIMFLSPALSGVILSVAPLEYTLLIDVATAIIGIAITSTVFVKASVKTTFISTSNFDEMKLGFHYLKKNSFIKRLLIYQILILFLISPSAFLTPLMISRTFGTEVWRLSASEMSYSLGMVFGGLLITTWKGFNKRMNTTLLAGTLYGVLMIGLGCAPFFIIYLFFNTLIGITAPCYNTPISVSIQERVDASMHGRIFSLMQIATSCALPFGMIFFGPICDYIPVQYILIIPGIIVVILSVYLFHNHHFEKT